MVKSNPIVIDLVQKLYTQSTEKNAPIWKDLARRLEKPNRNWANVNLSRLDRLTKKGDTVVVPGKVLGTGQLTKEVNVYSFNASQTAQEHIKKAKSTYGSIQDLLKKNPTGKGVRIFA